MNKKMATLVLLGVATTVAQAQSSVTVYGAVDVGYVKESHERVTMTAPYNASMSGTSREDSLLGFKGQEDLGGGLKATFQLEQRFNLSTGQSSSLGDFEGAANIGLSGSFGHVRFGRVNQLMTDTYRTIDPFDQNGVAGMINSPLRGDGRMSYAARYDSPEYAGIRLGASYTPKSSPVYPYWVGDPNSGYAVSATFNRGPLYLVANYNKAVDSSDSYNWNFGGAYVMGPARLSLGHEETRIKGGGSNLEYKSTIVGLSYTMGNGTINASYNRMDSRNLLNAGSFDITKYGIGYTYHLSKRTSVYANGTTMEMSNGTSAMHVDMFEMGMSHRF